MVGKGVNFATLDMLDFAKDGGLVPAIVQHAGSGAVLMLGYMNRDAIVQTLTRRRVVFFSRSRGQLWEKGETSGHSLELEELRRDCDQDALLVRAWPRGPVCHLGDGSCFGDAVDLESDSLAFIRTLESVIEDRYLKRPAGSYTTELMSGTWARIAQKVGEEGLEVALAGAGGTDREVVDEIADLVYHLLVMLRVRGLKFESVLRELEARHTAPRGPAPGAAGSG